MQTSPTHVTPELKSIPQTTVDHETHRISLRNLTIDSHSAESFESEVLEHAFTGNATRQIVTVNAQFYVLADKIPAFRRCLERAEYLCADGMSIVWACKKFGGEAVPRITGVDLIGNLCRSGAARGLRVLLLGGRVGTALATADTLRKTYPGLEVVDVLCPAWGFETDEVKLAQTLARIEEAKPHIVFVSMGAPRQEYFIEHHIRPLRVPIAIGIGGSFEILSGQAPRAPEWMRSKGLEWFYRFVHEPGRLWKRYLIGNLEFLLCVFRWRVRMMRVAG